MKALVKLLVAVTTLLLLGGGSLVWQRAWEWPNFTYLPAELLAQAGRVPPDLALDHNALAHVGLPRELKNKIIVTVIDFFSFNPQKPDHGDYTWYIPFAALKGRADVRAYDLDILFVQCWGGHWAFFSVCAHQQLARAVNEVIDKGTNVISISWGALDGLGSSLWSQKGCRINKHWSQANLVYEAVVKAIKQNIVVIASAGNHAGNILAMPACIEGVLDSGALASITGWKKAAEFSNKVKGTYMSPQGHIESVVRGTSFSTPVLASVVTALIDAYLEDEICGPLTKEKLLRNGPADNITDGKGNTYDVPSVQNGERFCELIKKFAR